MKPYLEPHEIYPQTWLNSAWNEKQSIVNKVS